MTPPRVSRITRGLAALGGALEAPRTVVRGGHSGGFAGRDGHVRERAMNRFWPLVTDGRLTLPDAP